MKLLRDRYGIVQDRYGRNLWVVIGIIGSVRIVLEFLGIALGHYDVFLNLFDKVFLTMN